MVRRGLRGLIPRDGRPGLSPAQLATVCVLQFLLWVQHPHGSPACRVPHQADRRGRGARSGRSSAGSSPPTRTRQTQSRRSPRAAGRRPGSTPSRRSRPSRTPALAWIVGVRASSHLYAGGVRPVRAPTTLMGRPVVSTSCHSCRTTRPSRPRTLQHLLATWTGTFPTCRQPTPWQPYDTT